MPASKVEKYIDEKLTSNWGDTWRELLDMYWDENMFARQLREGKLASPAEVDDRVERLVNWVNTPGRRMSRSEGGPRGCIIGDGSITCYRGGNRAS